MSGWLRWTVLMLCGVAGAARLQGQGPGRPPNAGPPPGFGGPSGTGGMNRPPNSPENARPDRSPNNGSGANGARGGALQAGPPGRWWDNAKYAGSVRLTPEQQRHMDAVFTENRSALVLGLDNLRSAQARLDAVSHSEHPTETQLQQNIEAVEQARADLLKASTHLQLQLRSQMTDEQIKRLEALH